MYNHKHLAAIFLIRFLCLTIDWLPLATVMHHYGIFNIKIGAVMDPLSWICHFEFLKIIYFIKSPKNRSKWTIKLKYLIKECFKIDNATQ